MQIYFSECLCRVRHLMQLQMRNPVAAFSRKASPLSSSYNAAKHLCYSNSSLRFFNKTTYCRRTAITNYYNNDNSMISSQIINYINNSITPLSCALRGIVVETNKTPNPDCLRFFSMELSFLKPEFSVDIPSVEYAYKSPLATRLFGVEGVVAVFIADEYVTVRKADHIEWDELIPLIQETIIEFAESNENVLSAQGEEELQGYNDDTEPEDGDDEVVLAVKELLATRIRPMLRADGGNVRYIDMDDGTVFLLLEGACKACPSSHITLKSGIERMLMHWIPEVCEALEVTDEMAKDLIAEKKLRKKMKENNEEIKAL